MKFSQQADGWIDADDRYKLTQGVRGWSVWWRPTALSQHNRVQIELPTFVTAAAWCKEHAAERAKELYLL